MKLDGRLVPVSTLAQPEQIAMYELMNLYYENVRPDQFAADLQEKDWVIQLRDPESRELCGFSTQMIFQAAVAGRPVRALFSGDTIIARERWGDPALAHVWGKLALMLIDQAPDDELYWFLISKGYKTYRFLPLFFREFYPRAGVPTPAWARAVINALAWARFPADYDADAGVVRAGPDKDRLRPGVADVTGERQRDPHVRFFLERNPGHAGGDELCCLAPLSRANFTPAAYRVIGPENHSSPGEHSLCAAAKVVEASR
jgi:hypothetical protein